MDLNQLIEDIATRVASKINPRVFRKRHPLAGQKKTAAEMRCRHTRCRERSLGPRFHYLCKKHLRS